MSTSNRFLFKNAARVALGTLTPPNRKEAVEQPRDENGRFASTNSGGGGGGEGGKARPGGHPDFPYSTSPHEPNPEGTTRVLALRGEDHVNKFVAGSGADQSNPVHEHPEVQKIEKQYPPANPNGSDTHSRYTTADGKLTPERQALHEKILDDLRSGKPVSQDKIFMMLGGGPASGKTGLLNAGVASRPPGDVKVDPDEIKNHGLPEMKALIAAGDSRAAAFVHEESSGLAKAAMTQSYAGGQNVTLDGTGDGSVKGVMDKITEARNAGYQVNAVYATCSIGAALERNQIRGEETGRLPPKSMAIDTHISVSRILPQLAEKGVFDNVHLFDTEYQTNGKPTLVMSNTRDGKMTIHHQELWDKFVAKGKHKTKAEGRVDPD